MSYGIYVHILKLYYTFLSIKVLIHILQEDLNKIFHKGKILSNLQPLNMACTYLYGKTHRNYVFSIKVVNYTPLYIGGPI